ncbi:Phosphotransferase enzyme family protein [Crateriforma conspicua]|uniref:Phosphotransferase enzyme family protein n=1 Tax=Crateriforma conspicua TaxID=2527996 RepID=A0A5C6FP02_9PLAN|nr:oxidoreductase family protein [Crateriforma conspicua]TWU63004.1 Phosphotransferase enzyme family protein [Crateriforma conspicua]
MRSIAWPFLLASRFCWQPVAACRPAVAELCLRPPFQIDAGTATLDSLKPLEDWICDVAGAEAVGPTTPVQSLWSGYGQIVRVPLVKASVPTVIVKQVRPPQVGDQPGRHPRGWDTPISHRRKLRSYEVESAFYARFADRCDDRCRVARCWGQASDQDSLTLVLEDLDAAGFPLRLGRLDIDGVARGLAWLANFHGTFLHPADDATGFDGLWPIGTYWHLGTRPDEWRVMPENDLKRQAAVIDQRLNESFFQTLVHGDAKVANMCFPADERSAPAMVDFQYVGRGCGMKDVAYFLSSCVDESECQRNESTYLAIYFAALRTAVVRHHGDRFDLDALETQWRQLYPLAWADFVRFLEGWCPGHAKLTGYSRHMVHQALTSAQSPTSSDV